MSSTCHLCGQDSFAVYLNGFPEEKRAVLKCQNCGLLMTDPSPAREELVLAYQDEFYGEERSQRFRNFPEKRVYLFRWIRAYRIKRLFEWGRVLDVECGRGVTLHFSKKWGWNCTSTQLSRNAAEYKSKAFRLKILEKDLIETRFEEGSFDLVILAHVPDPMAYLREISRILV